MIIIYPDKILEQKTEPVTEINQEIKEIVKEMKKTMMKFNGVGLAANQIGKNLSIFIAENNGQILTFINPEIVSFKGEKQIMEEGCLSLPGIFGYIKRYPEVVISYQDLWGKKKKKTVEGLLAQIVQHEIDHLNGKLFIEEATDLFKIENKNEK